MDRVPALVMKVDTLAHHRARDKNFWKEGRVESEHEPPPCYPRGRTAKELFLGDTTVKTHVSRVLMKLGLRDRVQAVVFAYEAGVARPGSE